MIERLVARRDAGRSRRPRGLVLVPTRQSGRRLREALAGYAARRQSAVFPPQVLTPEALLAAATAPTTAPRLEATLAWIEVLRAIELEAFRDVFPTDPPARNFAWSSRLAEQFVRLQSALAEAGLRLADVARRAGPDFPETARWAQLAQLEQRYFERLQRAGLQPPSHAFETRPKQLDVLEGVSRIVAVGVVDPLPIALELLATQNQVAAIDVLVFAPRPEAEAFDAWGRPGIGAWAERALSLADFDERVHLAADPAQQALRIVGLAKQYMGARAGSGAAPERAVRSSSSAEGALAVGVADPDLLPLLEGEASRAGVSVFNPEGRRRRNGALYHLLVALGECARSPTFDAVAALARCPDVLEFLRRRIGPSFSAARFLQQLDALRRHALLPDLGSARSRATGELGVALSAVEDVVQTLSDGEFPGSVSATLTLLFAGRMLDPSNAADVQLRDAAAAWTEVLRQCAIAAERFSALAFAEWWELALRAFGEGRDAEDKPAGALELQGWLELLFEDAPHLVVAGVNDGLVPEAIGEDAFLPESLRARLGLKTNAARFARDAYLLQAIAACRADGGRIDLLCGKISATGDPLRPSRLLLRCPDDELPARVAFLFRAPDPVGSHLPWRRAWRLRPRREEPPRQVAVTALRRWLLCPFRFYLKYVLRMESVDAAKSELDAFDFGSLCHAALEAMGREPALRDCTEASILRDFLLGELTRSARERHGADLALPLLIQVESARQRLAKFAELQARERADGWVIQEVERPFTVEIAGLVVRGKIDRIDRHERTGAVRVVDYKTSDMAVTPRIAHLRPFAGDESPPDWAVVTVDGKARVWSDLQLPLYRHALAPEWGDAIACGYANLPKAVGQTAFALWEDYTLELHASAMRCAEGVCTAIRAGEFWPPNENIRVESDEFATLFHHGVAESVEWKSPITEVVAE